MNALLSKIQNDHEAIAEQEAGYKPIPRVSEVSSEDIMENYNRIKEDIVSLFSTELEKILARREGGESPPEGEKPSSGEEENGADPERCDSR